jgi:hypothetical protein
MIVGSSALVGTAAGSACPQAASPNAQHPIKNIILRM